MLQKVLFLKHCLININYRKYSEYLAIQIIAIQTVPLYIIRSWVVNIRDSSDWTFLTWFVTMFAIIFFLTIITLCTPNLFYTFYLFWLDLEITRFTSTHLARIPKKIIFLFLILTWFLAWSTTGSTQILWSLFFHSAVPQLEHSISLFSIYFMLECSVHWI